MKNILLACIFLLTIIQCKEKEALSVQKELLSFSKPSEVFTLNNKVSDTLRTMAGIRLIIPEGTFIHQDGSTVTELIEIEIKEVLKPSEMIFNGITTMSYENQLASIGMIKLDAKSDGKPLVVNDGKSMMLTIPNNTQLDKGELFYGVEGEEGINWEYAGEKNDTIEVIKTTIPLAFGDDSVSTLIYKNENGKSVLVSDTTFLGDRTVGMEDISSPLQYEFKITKLGWINCDRFLDIEDKVRLTLKITKFNSPYGFFVYPKINSIMPIYFNNGSSLLSNLPNGIPVNIVIYDKIGEDYKWVNHEFLLGVTDELTLSLTTIPKEKLAEEIRKLDK